VNCRDNFNRTALHIAARDNREDIVEVLISRGADIAAQDDEGSTPLHYAAFTYGKGVSAAISLLKHGANSNAVQLNGMTPCYIAQLNDNPNLVELLQSHAAIVQVSTDNSKPSPLT